MTIDSFRKFFHSTRNNKFLTRALPFGVFMIGGSLFLKQFSTLRYEFRRGKKLTQEEAAAMGVEVRDIKTAQKDMLKEIEKEESDDWQNIRGPRPWEDSKAVQDLQRQDFKKES